ncbi:MAG: ABC-2 family transporter protein [Bacillota bacterium]|nr:ABC-2 family transporter protein [Bacillota bacterium]
MKRFRFYARLYILMISQYIKARMQFRSDFYISTFAMILLNITGIFSYWILFHSISSIDGWNFNQLVFLYSFALLATTPQQIFFDNLWVIRISLRNGNFIKYYFKPINTLFYYISEVFDIKGLGQLGLALVMLIYSSVKLGINWNLLNIIMLIVFILSSALIMISLMLLAASISFWVIESVSVIMLIHKLSEYSRYPITIFNGVFRFIFTGIIPIAFIAYYPSRYFLSQGTFDVKVFATPFVGIILFMIAYRVWTIGVNRYSGTGS